MSLCPGRQSVPYRPRWVNSSSYKIIYFGSSKRAHKTEETTLVTHKIVNNQQFLDKAVLLVSERSFFKLIWNTLYKSFWICVKCYQKYRKYCRTVLLILIFNRKYGKVKANHKYTRGYQFKLIITRYNFERSYNSSDILLCS